MATSYSANVRLQKPATSDRQWDIPINANTDALDAMTALGSLVVTTTETPSATRQVRIAGGSFIRADGTIGAFGGASAVAIPASSTVCLWLDASGQLATGPAFPPSAHLRLAQVVAGSATITQVIDARVQCATAGSGLGFVLKAGDTINGPLTVAVSGAGAAPGPGGRPGEPLGRLLRRDPRDSGPGTVAAELADGRDGGGPARRCRRLVFPGDAQQQLRQRGGQGRRIDRRLEASRPDGRLKTPPRALTDPTKPLKGLSFMPAYASIAPSPTPLGRPATTVGVYRSQPGGGLDYLPNIRTLTIRYREGADAGVARFRYVFDVAGTLGAPNSFAEVMAVDASAPGVVANDDRLVVIVANPDGSRQILFDGFAQVPEMGLAADREQVTFLAFGVAIRAWDTPIGGALTRDGADPSVVDDHETDLATHFNIRGLPNATPDGADAATASGATFPTFLDPRLVRSPDPRRYWTLPMAVRYLCGRHNPDQTYVRNPDGALIDQVLDSRSPSGGSGSGAFLPGEPGGFTSDDLIVPDYPATGKPWPLVVRDLLAPNGFGMAFRVDADEAGAPITTLDLFRPRDGSSSHLKDLYLQPRGATLDPGQTNLGAADLARDMTGVANAVTVESGLVRYEASFILAPGFAIAASDAANSANLAAFDRSGPQFTTGQHDAYRLYVLDETGEGHWDRGSRSLVHELPDLEALFNEGDDSTPGYVTRRRVPIGTLFSADANGKPLAARLSIATDYAGSQPGLWDGSGTWQPVGGGFELLKDRLGVWINAPNPNSWNIQPSRVVGSPYPAGVVKGVEDQANPRREAVHAPIDLRGGRRPRPERDGGPPAVEPDRLRDHAPG